MAYKLLPAAHKSFVQFPRLAAAADIGCIEITRYSIGDAETMILVKGDLVVQATSERILRHDAAPLRNDTAGKPHGA